MYHILPELKLRGIFLVVYFVNTNPSEERVQVLFSETELSELSDDSPNIFKKSNIYCYTLYGKTKCKILHWEIQCFLLPC